MNERQHRQIGVYATRGAALRKRDALHAGGVPAPQLHLLHRSLADRSRRRPDRDGGLAERLLLGALAGGACGALMGFGLLMLVLLGASGSAARAGWGLPVLGLGLGAGCGALLHARRLLFGVDARIRRALARGRVVLLVEPRNADEGHRAEALLRQRL